MRPIAADNDANNAYLALRRHAREANRPMSEVLQLYALEGFLDRLANSALASTLVLKGGVLLSAFDARRPTRDIDISALDIANDVTNVHGLCEASRSVHPLDRTGWSSTHHISCRCE